MKTQNAISAEQNTLSKVDDFDITLDKPQFEGVIASRRRAEFAAQQRGATDVRQGWSGEAAEPLLG